MKSCGQNVCMTVLKRRRKCYSQYFQKNNIYIYTIQQMLLSRASYKCSLQSFYQKHIFMLVNQVRDEQYCQSKKPVGDVSSKKKKYRFACRFSKIFRKMYQYLFYLADRFFFIEAFLMQKMWRCYCITSEDIFVFQRF